MILDAGLASSLKISKDNKLGEDKVQTLGEAVRGFKDWLENVIHGSKVPKGYMVMQAKMPGTSESENSSKIYDEYCPILLNQFKSKDFVKFETFDSALDEFYSKIKSQRAEQQQKSKGESAVHDNQCAHVEKRS